MDGKFHIHGKPGKQLQIGTDMLLIITSTGPGFF